ncbi:MAG: RNA-binding protein [Thermoplasmata archaeon]|nr:MAG: RNA-binding protein [Thermoplasmata archaeon]
MARAGRELKLKGRHRLKEKEARRILEGLKENFGIELEEESLDIARLGEVEVILSRKEPLLFRRPGEVWVLTLYLLLKHPEAKRRVTVDMGGVKAVSGGANVMAPGVVDCYREVKEGDIVWVADERHGRPLAVGFALMDSEKMVRERRGVAVKSLHHVGDRIWEIGAETS